MNASGERTGAEGAMNRESKRVREVAMRTWQLNIGFVPVLIVFSLCATARSRGYTGGSGTVGDPYRIADINDLAYVGRRSTDPNEHFVLVHDIDLADAMWGDAVVPEFSGTFDGKGYCIRNLKVTGGHKVGLLGEIMVGAHVTNLAVVDVNVAGSGSRVGGLAGVNNGTVNNCYTTGIVVGKSSVGGLIGFNDSGSLSNCYSAGSVSGSSNIGGLAGENRASIANCYASSVTASENHGIGGLVGHNRDAWGISNSFWDTGRTRVSSGDGGSGRTTAEMQDPNTFVGAGWDFVGEAENGTSEIWRMPSAGGYPALSAFHGYRPPQLQGRGTADDPYLISSPTELGAVVWYDRAAHYRLAASIDLSGVRWSTAVIPVFSGVFDGDNLVIRNLSIAGGNCVGLFGIIEVDGEVKDTGIVDVNVTSTGWYVGALAGYQYGAASNCYSTGRVAAHSRVGGLVGYNVGDLRDCWTASSVTGSNAGGLMGYHCGSVHRSFSTGTVTGPLIVGGLVGRSDVDSVIEDCHSTGYVRGEYYYAGGLLGYGLGGYVSRSSSAGAVGGIEHIGGLVGCSVGSLVEECYSRSAVAGDLAVGGLTGDCIFSSVSRCYGAGPIRGNEDYGGLFGSIASSIVANSFWDVEGSGVPNMCGRQLDDATGCNDSFGKTTAEMQTASTFLNAGWDFVGETPNGTEDIWWIDEGRDYPQLRCRSAR